MVTGVGGTEKRYENMDFRVKRLFADGANVLPQAEFLTGNNFYVNSAAAAGGDGRSPAGAVQTLAAAIALATDNNNDRIFVLPNHAETITGAGGLTFDVAGLNVIGVGRGGQRPRFLMDGAATVTALVTAADVTLHNLVFAAGHADIVTGIGVTATDVTLSELEFVENVATENFLTEIKATSTTDGNANGLTVINCRAVTIDASAVEFIELNADIDRLVVKGNFVCKDAATAGKFILQATGKDITNCDISYNKHVCGMTANDIFIDNDTTANSGIVAYNLIGHHDVAGEVTIDCDGVRLFNNYSASGDTASGALYPTAENTT